MRFVYFCLATLLSPLSLAGIITIEPDDYYAGADLGNPYPGVRLYDRRTGENITAHADSSAATGSLSFGHFWDLDNFYYNNDNLFDELDTHHPQFSGSGLVVALEHGTNYASIMGVSGGLLEAYLNAYDRDGNKLQSVQLSREYGGLFCDEHGAPCTFRLEITSLSPDIYYLMAGGTDSGRSFDHLQINVPEPGTGALALLAVAGLIFTQRRRALS